ncbi:hypothetical protein BSK63_29485 [Paenibacillus odorifer]|nr:hypothetical protein BSK57_28605 [Paenibacillus odorifer]OME25218.1 hypothetical protein BSK63_29485 [Paenibacillus odorifer]OME30166.1 hypothetical protein BSK46_27575 [Paenibacillus odorifer]
MSAARQNLKEAEGNPRADEQKSHTRHHGRLNRCIPNSTYGGVRGRLPYLWVASYSIKHVSILIAEKVYIIYKDFIRENNELKKGGRLDVLSVCNPMINFIDCDIIAISGKSRNILFWIEMIKNMAWLL